jgi:hypothetical protein
MPSTTDQTPGRWTEYYNANEEKIGDLKELNETPPNSFETITNNLILQPGELALEVATHPYNFILLSGTPASKKVQMVHHCFTTRDRDRSSIITGVAGDMKTAPLKSFYPREATANLVNPRTSGRSSTSRTHIPSIEQFLTCKSIDEFTQLNGRNDDQEKIENISNKPVMFWIHPSIFYILDGNREILATDAGIRIIESLKKNCRDERSDDSTKNSIDDETEKSPSPNVDETLTVTETARGYHGLVVFLWALSNGMGSNVNLFDPPGSSQMDAKGQQVILEIFQGKQNSRTSNPNVDYNARPQTETPDRLSNALIEHVKAMTDSTLKSIEREDLKKSMLSRLSGEAADLFILLSAKDWNDDRPRIHSFARQLLADKDMMKAVNLVTSETRAWRGSVSSRGLTQFLSTGYAATDVNIQPGGFTIFMFRPKTTSTTISRSTVEQNIRSMFGDGKLNDDTIKYFAKHEFYLADSVENLEIQLDTCVEFLDLMTVHRGIASEGFARGLRYLKTYRSAFQNMQAADHLFVVKVAYFLDRVFQDFINDLGNNRLTGDLPGTIAAAKQDLEREQTNLIHTILGQIKVGVAPPIQLPASLLSSQVKMETDAPSSSSSRTPTNDRRSPEKKVDKDKADKNKERMEKPHKLLVIKEDWILPKGKTYGNFFNKKKFPDNVQNWPVVKHHIQERGNAPLCMRYQSTGLCKWGCTFAHVKPSSLPVEIQNAVTERLHQIFE